MLLKIMLVAGFVLILYFIWKLYIEKVLKPLRGVGLGSDLANKMYQVGVEKLIPLMYDASGVMQLAFRRKIEIYSDDCFDWVMKRLVEVKGQDWVYNAVGDDISSFVKTALIECKNETHLDDEMFAKIVDYYLCCCCKAHDDPETSEWTAFGFLSWVNLHIDQLVEKEFVKG